MTTIQHRLRHGYPSKERIEAADRIDALEAQVAALTKDAERYHFLKEAKALTLKSDGSTWKRDTVPFVATHSMSAYGTSYGAYPSLDELVDAAIAAQKEQIK